MSHSQTYTSEAEIVSKQCPEDFSPDGNLDKDFWKRAARVRFDNDWLGQEHFPELETHAASLWTPTYLYFAFRCGYKQLNLFVGEDSGPEKFGLWDRDVVEIFLNPHPEQMHHYYEFEVSPDNKWIDLEINHGKKPFFDHTWNSGFQHATRIDEGAHLWTCEMQIPVSSADIPSIRSGLRWRINFYRCDGLGDDRVRRFMAWSPTLCQEPQNFFHVPSRFGVIRFE